MTQGRPGPLMPLRWPLASSLRWFLPSSSWVLALALALTPAARTSAAEPARAVVPYPPGGPADMVARQLQSPMQRALGQPIVIQNLPGAGGGLGVQRVLAEPVDGSQWLVGTPSDTIIAPTLNRVLGYGPEQLRLLGVAAAVPVVLVGGLHLRAGTPAALLAQARQPGAAQLSYGSFGMGSHAHLVGADFAARTGVDMLHVPFAGMAQLLAELMAGRIDVALLPYGGSLPDLVAQRRLRLYGFATAQRDAREPALPTLDEAAGLNGFRHDLWVGVFVPATMGEAAIAPIRQAMASALRDPEYRRQKMVEGALPAAILSPGEADRHFEAEAARYRCLIGAVPDLGLGR